MSAGAGEEGAMWKVLVLVCTKGWSVFGGFQGVPAAPGPGTKDRVLSGVIIQGAGGK